MKATLQPAVSPANPRRWDAAPWKPPWRKIGLGLACILALALAWEFHHVVLGTNFHTLVPGRVYRGGQPTGTSLAALVRRYGIRTVINLRGCCGACAWYWDEARACQSLGVSMEDVAFSAGRLPNTGEIKRLVEILDRSEYPIFIHCRAGADRTGLTSSIILLLQTDATLSQARYALGLRYGHLNYGKTANMDRFFALYQSWLADHDRPHDRAVFRHWLTTSYQGGWLRCRFEDWQPLQQTIKVDQVPGFRVAVRNTSDRAWQIKAHEKAGIHLYYRLFDPEELMIWHARCSLFEQTIAPGEVLHATLVLASMPRPGRYRLVVDMVEEQHCTFMQAGAEPKEEELDVRE